MGVSILVHKIKNIVRPVFRLEPGGQNVENGEGKMGDSNKDATFRDIIDCCIEVLNEEAGGAFDVFDVCHLIGRFLPELHPSFKTWLVITRAVALSAESAALLSSDSPEELFAKASELPGPAAVGFFADTQKEMLGTFDNEGYLVGHACVVLGSNVGRRYLFLDPTQRRRDSGDNEVEIDFPVVFEIQKDQPTVSFTFDNGVSMRYWLYPEIAVPNLSAEAQSIVERCVPKVKAIVLGSDDDQQVTPPGPRLH